MKTISRKKKALFILLIILLIGFILPQSFKMPVAGANQRSYNHESFWYYPWGKSGTHKGVDIFAKKGTDIFSSVNGLVLYCGKINMGGNIVVVLGPKWRIHYYAHLNSIETGMFSFVGQTDKLGTVGDSGNAKGKPSHLHYSIVTLIPYLWRIDGSHQGWKKMFYLNPINYLKETER